MRNFKSVEVQWFCISNEKLNRLPEWQRVAGVTPDCDVFLPAGCFMGENLAFLAASWDGTPMAQYQNHLYLSAEWLAKENTKISDDIFKIRDTVLSTVTLDMSLCQTEKAPN